MPRQSDGEGRASSSEPASPGAVESHASAPFGHAVGFLLSQTGDATARRFKGVLLAELGIEPRHFAVLRAIVRADNRSQQSIAEILHIPASSMVGLLDQLEARRLVARHLDPHDRRVRIVELTPKGAALLERATELALGVERFVCSGLSHDQREMLISLLQGVAANLGLFRGEHASLGGEDGPCEAPADTSAAPPVSSARRGAREGRLRPPL